MNLNGRALFNLLRGTWLENPQVAVQGWQVEDYRSFSVEELLGRLEDLGVLLTEEIFKQYADKCDSPEELADCLYLEENQPEQRDQIYLAVFELWRRLMPEKPTLSIFCDEIDRLIELYDRGESEEEMLQAALVTLEDILDRAVDDGGDSKEAFEILSSFCAHNLSQFLHDYIKDQLEADNTLYASELLEGFSDAVPNQKAFSALKKQLMQPGIEVKRELEDLERDEV